MHIVQLFKKTLHNSSHSCYFFVKHPLLFLFPLISLIAYIVLEAVILIFIYMRYGVHFFNPESVELFSYFALWELSIISALLLAPLYCFVTFFILCSKASLSYAVVSLLDEGSYSLKDCFLRTWSLLKELFKYAYLKTILIIVGESGIKSFLRKHVAALGGKDYIFQSKEDNWLEATFLVIPLLVFQKMSLQKAIQKSRMLMQETFGGTLCATFSFVLLIFFVVLVIASPVAHLIAAKTNGMAGIAIFFLFVGVTMCFIRSLEGIFHALVYQYCKGSSLGECTKEDIESSFIRCNENVW